MTDVDAALFEKIVEEVIRRLLKRGVVVGHNLPAAEPTQNLEINDKLVTLATLQDRLNGVAKLLVPRRAVVTPAVKDELKDRGIELLRT